MVSVLVLLFVALWFILRRDLFPSKYHMDIGARLFINKNVIVTTKVYKSRSVMGKSSDLMSFCYCVFSPFRVAITSFVEKRELILVLFVRLFDLYLFEFVGFIFLLGSGKGCVL